MTDDRVVTPGAAGFSQVNTDRSAEQERIEEALRRSEEKFFRVFLSSPAAMSINDFEHGSRFVEVNEAFERITGYRRDEVIGRDVTDVGMWADPRQREEALRELRAHGHVRDREHQFRRKNGDIGTGLGSLELVRVGNASYVVVTVVDITERKRAEEALRQSESKYRRLYESMIDAFAATDMKGRITESNRAFQDMLGYSGEELRRLTYQDLTPEEWHPLNARILEEQILTRGFSDVFQKEYRRKNGTRFPVELRTFLVRDSAGQPAGMWAIVRDITERKKAEEERTRLEARLAEAEKMQAVGRLAGGIAHDFNNLLTAVIGYSRFIADTLGGGHEATEYAREIESAAQRGAALIDQLLAFSRRKLLQPKVFDLNTAAIDFGNMLRRIVSEQIEVAVHPGPGVWRVRADPGEIGRVLMNLCLNARDAMPAGGTLTIETANAPMDEMQARLHSLAAGPYVELCVIDTGTGMDPETRAHVFEPFFTTKETGKGTGLGLATVLGIVEQSGGVIRCHSELGQGSRFEILLPAVTGEPDGTARSAGAPAAAARGGAEVVLLVEDEDRVRRLASRVLERRGYVVLEARNGREALSLCASHEGKIDLLLSDVVMPGFGGRELAERILKMRPEIRVLFVSGHTEDVLLKEGIKAGVPFLGKPFTPTDLAGKVREVLDSQDRAAPSGKG